MDLVYDEALPLSGSSTSSLASSDHEIQASPDTYYYNHNNPQSATGKHLVFLKSSQSIALEIHFCLQSINIQSSVRQGSTIISNAYVSDT